jgi:tetratricopeptide (TPR) repeat protein
MFNRSTTANDGPALVLSSRGRAVRVAAIATAIALLAFVGMALFMASWSNPDELRRAATEASAAGRWSEADDALRRLAAPTPKDWVLRAAAANNLNDNAAALAYLSRVPPDGPLGAQAALITARIERARYRARPLEQALLRALRLDSTLIEARRLLVFLYGTQGRRVELLAQFALLADEGPLTFDLIRHWCIAHQEQINDPADLKTTLERFVANDPDDRWSRLGLGNVLRQLDRLDQAIQILAPLPESDAEARACRAEVEFARGDLDAVARLVAGPPENHAKLARLRGRLALNRQEGNAALRFFRLSDAVEPNRFETIYGLAQALRQTGDRAAAAPYAQRADAHRALRGLLGRSVDADEPKEALSMRMASACEAAGYVPEARAWYRLATSLDPLDERAQQALYRLSASTESTPRHQAASIDAAHR